MPTAILVNVCRTPEHCTARTPRLFLPRCLLLGTLLALRAAAAKKAPLRDTHAAAHACRATLRAARARRWRSSRHGVFVSRARGTADIGASSNHRRCVQKISVSSAAGCRFCRIPTTLRRALAGGRCLSSSAVLHTRLRTRHHLDCTGADVTLPRVAAACNYHAIAPSSCLLAPTLPMAALPSRLPLTLPSLFWNGSTRESDAIPRARRCARVSSTLRAVRAISARARRLAQQRTATVAALPARGLHDRWTHWLRYAYRLKRKHSFTAQHGFAVPRFHARATACACRASTRCTRCLQRNVAPLRARTLPQVLSMTGDARMPRWREQPFAHRANNCCDLASASILLA